MPCAQTDCTYMLLRPIRGQLEDGSYWNTYQATAPLRADHGVPTLLAIRTDEPLLAPGVVAFASGSSVVIDGVNLFIASDLIPIRLIPTMVSHNHLFYPRFALTGRVISDKIYDRYCTAAVGFDVEVINGLNWATPTTVYKCYYNRDVFRFPDLDALKKGVGITLTGIYCGRDENLNFMLNVTDARLGVSGNVPTVELVKMLSPFTNYVRNGGRAGFVRVLAPGEAELGRVPRAPLSSPAFNRDEPVASTSTAAAGGVDAEVATLAHSVVANQAVADPRRGGRQAHAASRRSSPYPRAHTSEMRATSRMEDITNQVRA